MRPAMCKRSATAVSLSLIPVVGLIIILLGVAVYFLLNIIGGFRSLKDATDSGNLNVAKCALKVPSFALVDADFSDFSGLVDPSSATMNLQMYNRVVGQAYLVALNALSDRPQGQANGQPSQQGIADAMLVTKAANGLPGRGVANGAENPGVGAKLCQLFVDNSNKNPLFDRFMQTANSNSLRMFNADGQLQNDYNSWQVSFMGAGDATNVYISSDPSQTNLPYIGDSGIRANDPSSPMSGLVQSTINTKQHSAKDTSFLAGYTAFNFGPGWTLYGVPVYPGCQPHHVAARDFTTAASQNATTFMGVVPPNAYESAALIVDRKKTGTTNRAESYSIVGTVDQTYPASIPHGFIIIKNLPGMGNNQIVDKTDNVYGKELMQGIFLATTKGGGAAFSTNEQSLKNWVDYNNGKVGGHPPSPDGIFFFDPTDRASGIISMNYQGQPLCLWTDVSGDQSNEACSCLEGSFNSAYPPGNATESGDGAPLMAVEQVKKTVIQDYPAHPVQVPGPAQPSGLRLWQLASDHTVTGAAARKNNNVPKNNPKGAQVSIDGTLAQLIDQVVGDSPARMNSIYVQLAQRMTEIDPSTTQDAAVKWLQSQNATIPMGSTWYIYHDSGSWHFVNATDPALAKWMPASPPRADILPDGTLQRFATKYQTVNELVDPAHEISIHDHLYTQFNIDATPGYDEVDWQPSSGYMNELGQLTFSNYCGGSLNGAPVRPEYNAPD
jgi:hypothetical protein